MNYGISIVILSPNQTMLKEVRDSSPLIGVIYLTFKLFHKKLKKPNKKELKHDKRGLFL